MSTDVGPLQFLPSDASGEELMAAAVANEIAWWERIALASGGTVGVDGDVAWSLAGPDRPTATVLLTAPPGEQTAADLDRVLRRCRGAHARHVTVWTFDEAHEPALGPLLGARGLRWGGRPHWMVMDLHRGPAPPEIDEFGTGTDMTAVEDPRGPVIDELPCLNADTGPVRVAMAKSRPQRVWLVLLRDDGAVVGQSTVNITSGDLGVCGLYETEILETSRSRGLGLSRVDWIRRFALDLGAHHVVTNAAETVDSLYRLLGFRTLSHGRTWGQRGADLQREPEATHVAIAEAIGYGAIDVLESVPAGPGSVIRDGRLPNGMTPLQFAAHTRRPDSAEWLLHAGAEQDVLSLWDLGLVEHVRSLLRRSPELVNARRPRSGRTLLHVAVERDDAALITILLDHGGDPMVRDTRFDGSAVDWARELRRSRILALLPGGSSGQAVPE